MFVGKTANDIVIKEQDRPEIMQPMQMEDNSSALCVGILPADQRETIQGNASGSRREQEGNNG